jgi:hypothetical protein
VSAPKTRTLPEFYQHAVNVLFAVVIGLSFNVVGTVVIPVEEIPNDPVGTGILILGYIIVLTSWIGYSLSIKTSPHRGGIPGLIRFGLDVLIIFLFYYIVSLANPDNLLYREDVFLYLLPATYIVFLAWDITKYYEYKNVKATLTRTDRIRRIHITIDYLVIFLIMAFLYTLTSFHSDIQIEGHFEWRDLAFIGVSIVLTVLYRHAKWRDVSSRRSRKRLHKKSSHKSTESNTQT